MPGLRYLSLKAKQYTALEICLSNSVLHPFPSELVSVLVLQDALKTSPYVPSSWIFLWKRKSDPCSSKAHCMVMPSLWHCAVCPEHVILSVFSSPGHRLMIWLVLCKSPSLTLSLSPHLLSIIYLPIIYLSSISIHPSSIYLYLSIYASSIYLVSVSACVRYMLICITRCF